MKLSADCPYAPAHLLIDKPELTAIKAVQRGNATEEQQRVAWVCITEKICETYGLSYRPSQRDTDFAEGKRFVGLQLIKLSKLDPSLVGKTDERNRDDDGNPRKSGRHVNRGPREQPD